MEKHFEHLDAKRIVFIMKNIYVDSFSRLSKEQLDETVRIWESSFTGYDGKEILKALKEYVRTERTGFPPTPGILIGIADKNRKAEEENA